MGGKKTLKIENFSSLARLLLQAWPSCCLPRVKPNEAEGGEWVAYL